MALFDWLNPDGVHDAEHIVSGLCHAVLTPDREWAFGAARCQDPSTTQVCTAVSAGSDTDEIVLVGEDYRSYCNEHADEVKATAAYRWSRPIPEDGA